MGRVGEYEIGRTIAAGAYSKVKLVVHCGTKQTYVAKILPKSNRDVENDIRVEISILRKVHHDNVVQLVEILESPRNYYIILEAVLGGDLCALVMNSPAGVDEGVAARLFSQILQGLYACHQKGVAHRDLKPENILLTMDGRAKISDFGLSRLHRQSHFNAETHEYAETLTGTLAYVAPEVLLGQYDAFRADIWSLGCMLYVTLTSRFPFGGAQGEELEERIKAGEVAVMPPHVSNEARDLVWGLLRRIPTERLTLEQAMFHPWLRSAAYPHSPMLSAAGSAHTAAACNSTCRDATSAAPHHASASPFDQEQIRQLAALHHQPQHQQQQNNSTPRLQPHQATPTAAGHYSQTSIVSGGCNNSSNNNSNNSDTTAFSQLVVLDDEASSPVIQPPARRRVPLQFQ